MSRASRLMVATLAAVLATAATAIVATAPAPAQTQPVDAASTSGSPGLLRGWGSNATAQLGFTSPSACPAPTPTVCPTPFTGMGNFGIIAVAAGTQHTVILRADGTVWAVGNNTYAELGNGTFSEPKSTPTQVIGLDHVVAIAAANISLALKDDGTVWSWGDGVATPTQVSGLTDIVAIAAGGYRDAGGSPRESIGIALKDDGTVWTWGEGLLGQLGNGKFSYFRAFPEAIEDFDDVVAIAAGDRHELALKSDGTVWAWGFNWNGQLGNGTTDDSAVPVQTVGLDDVVAIDAGGGRSTSDPGGHSVAVKSDGTLWAWGKNNSGQLGDSSTTDRSLPVQVPGVSNVGSASAGGAHTLVVMQDGSVRAMGQNAEGQVGDGTTVTRTAPVAVSPAPDVDVALASAGALHSIVLIPLASLGEYTSMTPARFLDTRADGATADGQYRATGVINAGGKQDVQITGRNGIPTSGVSAVVVNTTVTEPTQPSFLTVWPAGFTRPNASNLNYVPGETVPNLVTVALGVGGKVSVYNNNGSTHAVLDVVGYYSSVQGPDGTRVHLITPARIMDTRGLPTIDHQSQGGGPVGQNQTRDLDVTGRGGVPGSGVTAVVVNVTVTEPTMFGYVTAYPGDVAKPNASNLNFVAGETVPNLAIVRVPASGIVKFYNLFGNTHLVVDVVGYYDDDESTDSGRVVPLFPGRLFDTRAVGPLAPNAALSLNMASFDAGITNSQASGYVLNTTVTEPSAVGYLTVYAGDVVRPLASNLNFVAGQTVPNLVMTKVGCPTYPRINFHNSPFGFTHVLADAFGVITNSLLKDTTVCAPPAVPAEIGAAEVREVDAPAAVGRLQLGLD